MKIDIHFHVAGSGRDIKKFNNTSRLRIRNTKIFIWRWLQAACRSSVMSGQNILFPKGEGRGSWTISETWKGRSSTA